VVHQKAGNIRRSQRHSRTQVDKKALRALPRDCSRRCLDQDPQFQWQLIEGPGTLAGAHNQAVTFVAPTVSGLAQVTVAVHRHETLCVAEALITVTHELPVKLAAATVSTQGLPSYTFERALERHAARDSIASATSLSSTSGIAILSMPRAVSR